MSSPATRVALYTRVSTDMQAGKDEGSLDTQEARLRAFLLSRPGEHEVRTVFREEGASGKSLDRPALQQLMRAVERDEVDLVVVTRLDRLSRSLLDFYELHRLFEKHNVRFVSLNETFDTSTPVGRAMLKLVLVFAELEREQTADRTRQAMQARAERGLWNGGSPPLGYDSQGNGHLDINAHEAELVRLIFDKYLELRSAPQVAKWLNDQGHRQKRFTSRRKGETGGKPFTPAAVRLMVQNRLYLGEITHKDEVFEGQHDPIIDRDVFDRARNVMEGNAKNRRGPPLRAQHDWPLTGVAQCACGYALTSSAGTGRGGKTYFYYRCVGLQKNVDHPCEVRQVRAELLEDAVFALVREAAREPALLAEAVEEANRMAREHVAPLRDRVDSLRRDMAEVEDEGQRTLRQILTSGVANSDLARKLLADIEARRDALRAALSTAEGELAGKEAEQLDLEMVTQAIQGFDSAFEHLTSAEKREFLQLLIHKATVHKDRVDVELYDGCYASRYLAQVTRNGLVVGPTDSEGRNATGREPVDGFAAGEEWLPEVVSTEARPADSSSYLTTWETRVALPERPSFGRNRFRPCEEARLSAPRRRLRVAGHARNEPEASSPACGPAEGDAGQACGPADDEPPVDPWAGALARVRAQLARARQWQTWLDEDPERCAADLARRESLSRARVSQVLKLLTLDATLLADLDRPDRAGPVPSELVLRSIAELPEPAAQRARYRAVCVPSAPTSGGTYRRDDDNAVPAPRHDDFLHDLDRARRYQRWLDEHVHNSLASIGRAEGVSGARVGQLLALLHLDPEIVAVLERPKEALPRGLTHKAVREIARLRGHGAQRAAFGARWPGVLVEVAAK